MPLVCSCVKTSLTGPTFSLFVVLLPPYYQEIKVEQQNIVPANLKLLGENYVT